MSLKASALPGELVVFISPRLPSGPELFRCVKGFTWETIDGVTGTSPCETVDELEEQGYIEPLLCHQIDLSISAPTVVRWWQPQEAENENL